MGVLFFAALLGYALVFKILVPDLEIGSMIFCAFSSMAIISYLVIILLGCYSTGAYIIIVGGMAGLIGAGVFLTFRNRCGLKALISPSLMIFIGLVLFSVIFLQHAVLRSHDDYSFWGRAVKELFVFNKSYFNVDSNIAHSDYCPAFVPLQYAVVRVFGWQNKYLFYVVAACLASILSMLTDFFTWRKIKYAFAFVALLLAFYPYRNTYSIASLYIDGPLAMIFAGGIVKWFNRKDNSLASILPSILCMAVLPLLKIYIGLLFACVFLVLMLIEYLRSHRDIAKATRQAGFLPIKPGMIIVPLIIVLFMQFSWSAYYHYHSELVQYERQVAEANYSGDSIQETTGKPVFSIRYLFSGNPRSGKIASGFSQEQLKQAISSARRTMYSFFDTKLNGTPFTIFSLSMLVMLGLFILVHYSKNDLRQKLKRTYITIACAAMAYAVGTFATLLIQPEIAGSMIRYAGVILIPGAAILFFYCNYIAAYSDKQARPAALLCILVAVVLLLVNLSPSTLKSAYQANQEFTAATHVRKMLARMGESQNTNERIFFIDNVKDGKYAFDASGVTYCYQYFSLPVHADAIYFPYGSEQDYAEVTEEYIKGRLIRHRADKIVCMIDNVELQEKIAGILGISPQAAQPWVIQVNAGNGQLIYSLIKN